MRQPNSQSCDETTYPTHDDSFCNLQPTIITSFELATVLKIKAAILSPCPKPVTPPKVQTFNRLVTRRKLQALNKPATPIKLPSHPQSHSFPVPKPTTIASLQLRPYTTAPTLRVDW
ncbi:hypothetical protein ACFX2G_034932 [Malus domestica]